MAVTLEVMDVFIITTMDALDFAIVMPPPLLISIHQATITMAFTHVNSLTATGNTSTKTLAFTINNGAVSVIYSCLRIQGRSQDFSGGGSVCGNFANHTHF